MKPSSLPGNLKAEEIDDSDGEFGMFPAGLFCGWIQVPQAADAGGGRRPRPLHSPRRQNLVDLIGDSLAGGGAVHSIRQQFLVLCVVVANRGDNRHGQGVLLQLSAGLRPADAPASPYGGVFGDRSHLRLRAAGEQHRDLFHHPIDQSAILFAPVHGSAQPCGRPLIDVFHTFLFSLLERGSFNKDALPLVAPS
jgi:hypothetical protein